MPLYLTHFTCEPPVWPRDRKEELAAWAANVKEANALVEADSAVKFSGWINNSEGYALVEAPSKTDVIRLCAKFWPLFRNDITEIVPTAEAGAAILAGVAEGWER